MSFTGPKTTIFKSSIHYSMGSSFLCSETDPATMGKLRRLVKIWEERKILGEDILQKISDALSK